MFPFSQRICARLLTEIGCSLCGGIGFVEGTTIRVANGWRAVELLDRQDWISVSPKTAEKPVDLQRSQIWLDPFDCPSVVRPLLVPAGALGNDADFLLQQDMRVIMWERDVREALGTPFVSVRGADLEEFRGIQLADPPKRAWLIMVSFEREQIVEVAGGAQVICPPAIQDIGAMIGEDTSISVIGGRKVRHLDAQAADAFLAIEESEPDTRDNSGDR